MEAAHHRHPRYYQPHSRSHGFYSQYQPSAGLKDASSWSLWPDLPPPTAHPRPRPRCRWCNVLAAATAFLVILAVIGLAGFAIYMGALKLEMSQYLVFEGSFRVVSGDSFDVRLSDHASDTFQRKAQVYNIMIESIFRRSELSSSIKQCLVLGFTNGSLVVFFRLILDRRKITKKPPHIEERVQDILVKGVATMSLVKNIKIDKSQVFLKRPGEDSNYAAPLEKEDPKNQSLEIHNGLLRKSPPRTLISHYTRKPLDKSQSSKPTSTYDGIIEGSFKLSSSEAPGFSEMTTPFHNSESTSETTTSSSHKYPSQTINNALNKSSKIDLASSIDFYQHSPALNAVLLQKLKSEKVQSTTTEPTEPAIKSDEIDLITLLPYAFQNQEEPWKPILPENFTRYPERRPFVTEDYSSQGVGVVEVVLDQEDLASSIPLKPVVWPDLSPNIKTQEYYNLENPLDVSELSIANYPIIQNKYRKETFSPRSDEKVSFLLNTQDEKNGEKHPDKGGDIQLNNDKIKDNVSLLNDNFPDFPIIQQFHNLDALLRSYNLKEAYLNHKMSETPVVTLLPTRSYVNMNKQIRPRPQVLQVNQEEAMRPTESTEKSQHTQHTTKFLTSQIMLEITPSEDVNKSQSEEEITMINEHTTMMNKEIKATIMPENYFLEEPKFTPSKFGKDVVQESEDVEKASSSSSFEGTDSVTLLNTEHSKLVDISTLSGNNMETTSFTEAQTEVTQLKEDDKFLEVMTQKTQLNSNTMTSRNNRKSKMANWFQAEEIPLKFDLQENQNKESFLLQEKSITNEKNYKQDSNYSNQSTIVKLKDTKMQEVLEHVILNNLTSPTDDSHGSIEDHFTSTDHFNSSTLIDLSIAQNRKYVHSSNDNKNSLIRNSSFFGLKPDLLYYLKHPKNESSHKETNFNNFVKNGNTEEDNKTTPNYVLNKDGFLMLTKVYNKAPATTQHKNETMMKSNTTSNHLSDCSGSMKMMCGSGECINALSRCNHLVDCTDGSDEKNCTCAEFLKAQYLTRKICDGVVDCWDFSDENSCEWCRNGQYVCSNSRVCVDHAQLCDGDVDCPNGDDEKNCVSIAPNISEADSMQYHSSGILMIRKEGHWGKLCTQNFDELSSIFKSRWTLDDLGKVVCKKMTYRLFSSIEHINDTNKDEPHSNRFYELLYSKEAAQLRSSRLGLTFGDTNCTDRKVVRITCSNLECGVRPQANSQWGRWKRVAGARRSRIVGGGNAGPGSWPWLAALYKEGEFQCGATLINDRWLLSAGHCFYHALDEYWVARLGALRRGTNLPSPYEQLRAVSQILLHPEYVDAGFINDISLLQLERPVTLTSYVRPICLPPPTAPLTDGRLCTVIGWGQLFEVGRIFPDTLQEVQLPMISTAECRKRTLFLPLYKVTENMFCAGYDRGGRDACLGDSGGPLMCQENNGHWTLMGVTSNGYGCARANRPGVYTKVANYVDWIHSSTAEQGLGHELSHAASRRRNVTCHGHRCPLGECLPPARICNGFMECSDGSDEKDCW